jgi:diguanylate cyclase (GGDEF)-like protein
VFDFLSGGSNIPYESKMIEELLEERRPFYLPVSLEPKREKKIWVHSLPIVLEPEGSRKIWVRSDPGMETFSAGVGHVNVAPDPDGVVRTVTPYLEYGGEGYWYLPIRAAYDYLGSELEDLKDLEMPLDDKGSIVINWAGPWQEVFERFSYEELVRNFYSSQRTSAVSKTIEKIKGKICLIGITDPDLLTAFVSPVELACPSVGIHAHVVNSILTRRFVIPAPLAVSIFSMAAVGLAASFLFSIFRKVPSLAAGLALAGLWVLNGYAFFCTRGILLPVVQPLCLIFTLFVFSAIYSQIAASKEHSRLFDLATRDGLTGVYVIRHFREILNQVVLDTRVKKEAISLILIDIDDFKAINDQHGHPAGDMVLKKTAGVIRSCLRSQRPIGQTDFIARYGGEEFIVLLRNIPLEPAASLVGERIRKAVEQTVFQWKNIYISVRVSVGIGILHPGERVPDPMVHRADQALYRAKRTGKNKVCTEAESVD